jgi:hypothetical protein
MSITRYLSLQNTANNQIRARPEIGTSVVFPFSQIDRNLYPYEHSNVQLAGKRS